MSKFWMSNPSSLTAIAPDCFISQISAISCPFSPFVIEPQAWMFISDSLFAFESTNSITVWLSAVGFVFGIPTTVVMPPFAAALEAV